MIKIVTLKCRKCGETFAYRVGADEKLSSWHDAAALVRDKKEYEKLLEAYAAISDARDKSAMSLFGINPAESLSNIRYDVCGEECTKLIETENPSAYFCEKATESIAPSAEKWAAAAKSEGIFAFEAMYMCPRTHHVRQGLHLSMRHKAGDKLKHYVCRNACDECGATMTLLDDGNVGFMHEDCPTVGRCSKCNGDLAVAEVSFKVPTKENNG